MAQRSRSIVISVMFLIIAAAFAVTLWPDVPTSAKMAFFACGVGCGAGIGRSMGG